MEREQSRRTALVVDDVPAASLYIRRVLERRHGVQVVIEAHTAAEAVVAYKQLRPDLVTLDLVLPDEHGLVLLRRLQQVRAGVPVIVITADQEPAVAHALRQQGAAAVLAKPVALEALDAAVAAALASPRHAAATAEPTAQPAAAAPSGADAAPQVLIVEDDATTAALLAAAVRRAGCQVATTAGTLAQASHQVRVVRPALLLLDVTLPDGDGLEWLERLPTSERPATIVVSAHCERRCIAVAQRLGLAGYLLKPVSLPEVVARINGALARSGTPVAAVP